MKGKSKEEVASSGPNGEKTTALITALREMLDRNASAEEMRDTWNELTERFHGVVRGWSKRSSLSEEEIDLVTQDTMLKVFTKFEGFRPTENFRAWLAKVRKNCAHDLGRKKQSKQFNIAVGGTDARQQCEAIADHRVPEPSGSDFLQHISDELFQAIAQARGELSEQTYTIFIRGFTESTKELAEELGIREHSVETQKKRFAKRVEEILLSRGYLPERSEAA